MILKRGGRIKKESTRIYEQEFQYHLNKYKPELNLMKLTFDKTKHFFHVEWTFFIKKQKFFTEKGIINQKFNPDLDNLIKTPQDLIFDHIGNDCFITKFTAEKKPSERDVIQVHIRMLGET